MITEIGRVVKIERGIAVIEIQKKSACAQCHAGCACNIETGEVIVEANDPIGVRVNQQVEVTIPYDSALKASFVVYVIPLCALIVGMLSGWAIGQRVGVENIFEMIGGFGCLGLSFLFVHYYNNLFKKQAKNQPVITRVLVDA